MALDKGFFKDKKVLITGGAGFIGSALCIKLIDMGSEVTVLDALLPLYGGNLFNLKPVMDKIKFVEGDIRDRELINDLVRGQDIIFDFAAQVSYTDSKEFPFLDIDINGVGHMNVLEAMRLYAPKATYIFSSSRLAYGKLWTSPVKEDHPTIPLSLYGVHKLLVERYCDYYFKTFGLKTIAVRLPNPYGVRQQMKHNKYSLVGWFLRQAMDGGTITIFGDGKQLRDYLYIDDIVEGFLLLAERGRAGEIYNMGSKEHTTFVEMVDAVLKEAKSGKKEHIPWPENYEKNETGDYLPDTTKIKQDTGWEAKTSLQTGIRKMAEYYSQYRDAYWLSGNASIELATRDHISKKFPDLSPGEQDKMTKKLFGKLESGSGAVLDVEKVVGTLKGKRVLDAGSGLGVVALGFAQKGASVTGVEDDKAQVTLSQYIAQANKQKIDFIYSKLDNFAFPDKTFDIVVSIEVLNRVLNHKKYLEEVLRVLKPGGIVFLSFPTMTGPYSYQRLLKDIRHLPSRHGELALKEDSSSWLSKIKMFIKNLLLPQTVLTLVKK